MPFHKSTNDVDILGCPPLPEVSNQVLTELPAFEKRDGTIRCGGIRKGFQWSSDEEVTRSERLNCVTITGKCS